MFTVTHPQPHTLHNSGFSVVELMVTISIIVIVTGLSLTRYSDFNNTILLKSQAYEMAFDIRQAQMSGISVRTSEGVAARSGYGIHVSTDNPSSYYFFLDNDPNNSWFETSELIDTFVIDPRFVITDICIAGSCGQSAASIIFRRPNFDAIITNSASGSGQSSATIVVAPEADASVTREIKVYRSGQITVE